MLEGRPGWRALALGPALDGDRVDVEQPGGGLGRDVLQQVEQLAVGFALAALADV